MRKLKRNDDGRLWLKVTKECSVRIGSNLDTPDPRSLPQRTCIAKSLASPLRSLASKSLISPNSCITLSSWRKSSCPLSRKSCADPSSPMMVSLRGLCLDPITLRVGAKDPMRRTGCPASYVPGTCVPLGGQAGGKIINVGHEARASPNPVGNSKADSSLTAVLIRFNPRSSRLRKAPSWLLQEASATRRRDRALSA
eukprot:scaffold9301_cov30-Tisochrysis_lutea.AAC.3